MTKRTVVDENCLWKQITEYNIDRKGERVMALSMYEINERYMLYRSFNITVIKKLWKSIKGDYGKPTVKEPYDPNNLYKALQMGKEKIRLVVGKDYTYDMKKEIRHSVEVENRTGIPKEYLYGFEMIQIPNFDYNTERLEEVYEYKELFESYRDKIADNLKDKTQKEIEELAERAKLLNQKHKKQLKSELEDLKMYIQEIKQYNSELEKALETLAKEDISRIEDKGLYKLLYFIHYSKKFDEHSAVTINDVIKIMNNTGYHKLQTMGDDTLREYRIQLENQMRLVDAVFTIREDEKKHKN